jgi:hypothetical protein
MLIRRIAFIALALGSIALLARSTARSISPADTKLIYTATPRYEAMAWLHGEDRFPQGAHIVTANGSRVLVPDFFATADAAVSFDATHILFAGKRAQTDRWQIWEIAAAGSDPRRITTCADDCVQPFYLPDDRVVYARRIDGRFVIEVSSPDGAAQPLTFIPGTAFPTDVLRDGRILFEAGDPLGSDTASEFYTVYSDGSGVESYRCDHGKSRHSGKQLSSGDIVFATARGLGRFTSALAREAEVKTTSSGYAGDVAEDSNGDWLISSRLDSNAHYTLHRWNPGTNSLRALAAMAGTDIVQPQLLTPRPTPNRHPSGLHDWDGANLLCLNAYTSKLKIADGSIASIRLYTRSPKGEPVLLGSSPVESDGSFFLHVPSEQPLQIELLDRSGAPLQREHGWFWMRRGEQRECVGCHAGPERAPENAVPAVLLRSTDPVDMTSQAPQGVH